MVRVIVYLGFARFGFFIGRVFDSGISTFEQDFLNPKLTKSFLSASVLNAIVERF